MVVLELEILVEDGGVELNFAVELVADFFPVGRRLGHGFSDFSSFAESRRRCGAASRESQVELGLKSWWSVLELSKTCMADR
jgi:hypothetical protein